MEKSKFEEIIKQKAESEFLDLKNLLEDKIRGFFEVHKAFNAHSSGNSTSYDVTMAIEGVLKKKKPEIIESLEAAAIKKIMKDLENVQFLFRGEE